MDTGIRVTHTEFNGRAIPTLDVSQGYAIECRQGDNKCTEDGHGHGTHCAGVVGGKTKGVATGATLHAVRACSPRGRCSHAGMLAGMDWIKMKAERPAVLSMSLGMQSQSQSMKRAVDELVAAGVTVVVSAGNRRKEACTQAPAFVPSAVTVGSISKGDRRSGFSNYGKCVDIWAPGAGIISSISRSDNAYAPKSGTSMACPHVAGAAALVLQSNATMRPEEVAEKLIKESTKGVVKDE